MAELQNQFLLNLIAYGVQRDINPSLLCESSGVSIDDLKAGQTATTGKQVNDLWTNAVHLSKDKCFGLHFGESLQMAALGVVGQVIQYSSTIGDALAAASSMVPLITDMFTLKLKQKSKSFVIEFIPNHDLAQKYPESFRQQLEMSMVFTIHEVDGLILKKLLPMSVKFACNIEQPEEYDRVFRIKPLANAGEYSIEIHQAFWNEPIITANHHWQSLFLQKAIAMTRQGDGLSLKEKISNYLISNAYLGIPTLEQIAANFNVSARSLQRRLRDEDVTYQELADDIRKSLALHYLATGHYQIKEIAYMLGYNEISAFTRAFKRWTGSTPGRYAG